MLSAKSGAVVRWTTLPKAEAPTEPAGKTRQLAGVPAELRARYVRHAGGDVPLIHNCKFLKSSNSENSRNYSALTAAISFSEIIIQNSMGIFLRIERPNKKQSAVKQTVFC